LRSLYKNIISVFAQDVALRIVVTFLLLGYWLGWISFYQLVVWHSLIHFVPPLILSIYLIKIGEFSLATKHIEIPKKMKRIIFQYSSFNYINTIGAVLINSLDVIMLAQYVGLKAAGVFSTIMFLISALLIPYRSIVRIASPLVSEYWKHRNFTEMQSLYQKVSSVSLFIGLSFFLVFWMNIDFLFSFLKPEFKIGIWIFFYLMIGRLLDMYFGLNGAIFTTSKKYKYDLIFTIILVALVYGLKLLFIPWWGSVGAAASTAIALVIYNLGRIMFVYFNYKIHPFTKEQFWLIGLSLVTLYLGYFLNPMITNDYINFLVNLTIITSTFFIPIYFFKLEEESINYLKKARFFLSNRSK
jgi:O-antigen/teichoic acid export membrane protein